MLTRSDDLEMVLTVVDAGGFSAAAEALGVQVAKVSRSVSKVELQLGVSIFNRTTRRVELTEEGRQFVDSVRVGLQMIQSAEEEIVSRGELPKGRLRVDAASPFVFHQLVPLVQSFKEAYPDIELELTSNEGFVDLLEKRTDVAIRIGKLSDSTLHARPLGKSLLHIVASPDYLAKRGVPTKPEDLSSHQIVGFAGNKVLNHWPLPNQSDVAPTVTASNGETVRQLVLAGNGIACLSGFMVQEDMAAGRLIPILEQDKLANTDRERVNAVYYKSSSVSKRISAFIDLIQPRLKL
ncbi:LysR family transcriptional regulator [Vibrio sp. F13]|uniref:LysR family transcriptional regulator n=1 Tax=unclassified Vibrio TaxID=2614977 RepID=UPI000C8152FE|nr:MULTISPECIES: LysR family transcriptional regulator [unclassified Vibrio]PMO02429.1 LysR family transcriptional regulator [Vibrio sp. 10N.222.55.C12]PMO16785.1 LysR family transcriptional regulator [Vibrio sp. 10N.222.54.F10]TKF44913.1 LysR family transcriptional regulator [Vibrio sp. F13]TKF54133.1 LysR family transcriptional regulator [Vibrio sp. F13]TKF73191.1 LysR family transcriptional regulator [Vibrio sp. F13]